MFGPSTRSPCLLCPLLTSATSSCRLSTTLALGKVTDLPGYCALTFTLMPAAYMYTLSGQVSGFGLLCFLAQTAHLLCDSCSSGQRFAYSFLRISPRGEHPCCSANDSPCRARLGNFHPLVNAPCRAHTNKAERQYVASALSFDSFSIAAVDVYQKLPAARRRGPAS